MKTIPPFPSYNRLWLIIKKSATRSVLELAGYGLHTGIPIL